MKFLLATILISISSVCDLSVANAEPKSSQDKQGIIVSDNGTVNNNLSIGASSFNLLNLTKNQDGSLNMTPISSFAGNGIANFQGMSSIKDQTLEGNSVSLFGSIVDQRGLQTVDTILKTQENVVSQLAARGAGLGGFLDQFGVKNNNAALQTLIQNSTFNFTGVKTPKDLEAYDVIQDMLDDINSGNKLTLRTRHVSSDPSPFPSPMIDITGTDKGFFAISMLMQNENGFMRLGPGVSNYIFDGTNLNNAPHVTDRLVAVPEATYDKMAYYNLLNSPKAERFAVAMLTSGSSISRSADYIFVDDLGHSVSREYMEDPVSAALATKERFTDFGYSINFNSSYSIMNVTAEEKNKLLKGSDYQSLFSQLPAYFNNKETVDVSGQGAGVMPMLGKNLSSLTIAGETNEQGNLFSGTIANAEATSKYLHGNGSYQDGAFLANSSNETIVYGYEGSKMSDSRVFIAILDNNVNKLFNSDINYSGKMSFANYNNGAIIQSTDFPLGLGREEKLVVDKNYDSGLAINGIYNISLSANASSGSEVGNATWKTDVNNDGVLDSLTSRITLDSLDKNTGIMKAHVSAIDLIDGKTLETSSLNVYDDTVKEVWGVYATGAYNLDIYDNNNLTFLIGDFNEDGNTDVVGVGEFMHSRTADVNGDGIINEFDSIITQGTFS